VLGTRHRSDIDVAEQLVELATTSRIRDHVAHWNADAKPFTWTATADEILAKARWVQTGPYPLWWTLG
jgi:hypothetical protein